MKEELLFAWDLSLENSADFYLCLRLALVLSLSYFFFLSQSLPLSLCIVLNSISSNIERFSPSTHLLLKCLSLKTLMFIRIGLPILVELIDLVNSVIILISQTTLLRWLTFLFGSQTVIQSCSFEFISVL